MRTPAKGSLRWFASEWLRALRTSSDEALAVELARLSYENRRLRERLESAESRIQDVEDDLDWAADFDANDSGDAGDAGQDGPEEGDLPETPFGRALWWGRLSPAGGKGRPN